MVKQPRLSGTLLPKVKISSSWHPLLGASARVLMLRLFGSSHAWKETIWAVYHLPGVCLLEPDGRPGIVGGFTFARFVLGLKSEFRSRLSLDCAAQRPPIASIDS